MKTNKEIISVVSDYTPHIWTDLLSYFNTLEEVDLDAVDETANKYFDEYYKEFIEGKTPLEDTMEQLSSCDFGRELIEKSTTKGDITPLGGNELFYFQVGTTRTRANHFLENGLGYVRLERLVGEHSWDVISRTHGLQVSKLTNNEECSSFARLQYYAKQQSTKTCGDEPCVLVGAIPAKHVYTENVDGEYAISRRDFDKIRDAKILTLDEYQETYNK